MGMLVLSRKQGEVIIVTTPQGERIEITTVDINRGKIRLGITTDPGFKIYRKEIQDEIDGKARESA